MPVYWHGSLIDTVIDTVIDAVIRVRRSPCVSEL